MPIKNKRRSWGNPNVIPIYPHDVTIVDSDEDALETAINNRPLSDIDDGKIEALLNHIDPDCDYGVWTQVGMALHHQFSGSQIGLDFWRSWSSKSKSKFKIGECERKWASFHGSRTPITLRTLIKEYGTAAGTAGTAGTAAGTAGTDWRDVLDALVDEFNINHASVMIGGKHRIMRKIGNRQHEFIPRKDFDLMYANTSIKTGEKLLARSIRDIYKTHAAAWAEHPRCRTYKRGVVFLPGQNATEDCYNLWRGFCVEPRENHALLDRLLYHIRDVLCGGVEDLYQYTMKWLAYTFQNPGKPAGAAIIMRGEQGSGKSLLGTFYCAMWGDHSMVITNPAHLVGNFNAHLSSVCALFSDEAFYSGDRKHEGILKALITENTIAIERKGIDVAYQKSCLKILMATNSEYAVPATSGVRRFCVLDVSDKHVGDTSYFDALRADMDSNDVRAAFLHHMLNNMNLVGWNTGMIPDSVGLRAQREFSFNSMQQWLQECLIDGSFNAQIDGFHETDWIGQMSSENLFNRYREYCDTHKFGQYNRFNKDRLSKYLAKMFKRKRDVGERGRPGFVFGDIKQARAVFERFERIKLDLGNDD